MKETKKISFDRNGKRKEMEVSIKWFDEKKEWGWVTKTNGKGFFGKTGYYKRETAMIKSYRGKELATNVQEMN